ncbi:exported hypothetical protein [Vibrio nigripulchritudo FTn2]|nr:Hypothetical protein VIBNIAM115_1620108 [Vibrio nigripulchritudo AM115]CCN43198.1 exported hypothetical protein [Vibrio nigripulchritudo FTn2]
MVTLMSLLRLKVTNLALWASYTFCSACAQFALIFLPFSDLGGCCKKEKLIVWHI